MRTKVKKLTSVILAAVMMLGILTIAPLTVSAATYGDFEYTAYNGTIAITGYTGSAESVEVPSKINGKMVTDIRYDAFAKCLKLKNVVLNKGIETIGFRAFKECINLENVTIPDSVKTIDTGAFARCYKLKKIIIPDSVQSLGNGAFYKCINLTQVNIPNGVKTIPGYFYAQGYADETVAAGCFQDCRSIKNIIIPSSVSTIKESAFSGCTSLSSVFIGSGVKELDKRGFYGCDSLAEITVDEKNANYSSLDGVLFNKDKTNIVIYPNGKKGTYSLPNKVTKISSYAFCNCSGLTSVTIPNSVTSIGDSAFSGCTGLTNITIPNSVTSIEGSAFSGCTGLTNIMIPNSVTSIEGSAFSGCAGLTNIMIPNSVTSIGGSAFSGCTGLTSITIPESVTSLYGSTFDGCTNLKKIEVSQNNENYSSYNGVLLDKDGYNLIRCPEGKSGNFVVPDSVGCIESYAFYNCTNLTNIQISENVYAIEGYAFENCKSLEKFVLPDNVYNIGYYGGWYELHPIFSGCTNLKEIEVSSGNDNYSSVDGVLYDKEVEKLIYCPAKKSGEYTVPKSIKSVTDYAFDDCNSLESIVLPESMPEFSYSLYDLECCPSLKSIKVTGNNAYYSAEDGVLFNKDKTEIYVFPRSKEGNYTIPNSVTEISSNQFSQCTGLTGITIPNSVTQIVDNPFNGNLKSIKVSEGNKYFCSYDGVLFNKDKTEILFCVGNKKEFVIPNGVKSISGAFNDCSNLTSVTIPNSVTSVYNGFNNCPNLTSITIPQSVISIYDNGYIGSFLNCGKNFTIYGYGGTEAEACALRNDFNFVQLQVVPTSVALNKTTLTLDTGKTSNLKATVYPSNASNKKCTWSSSNTSVATVDKNGKVTAKKAGTATITVKTSNGKTANCKVTVNLPTPQITSLSNTTGGIKISWNKVDGAYGYRLYYKPASGGWKRFKDTTATSFTDSGVVPNKTETYTIRCIDKNGKTVSGFNSKGWSKKYTPVAPTITRLSNTSKGVSVTWNKIAGVYGYRLYQKTSNGWKRIKDTTATSYTDSAVSANQRKTYTIRCIDKNGKTVSGFNSKGWSKKYTPVAPTISKLDNTSGGIKLSWNKIAGVYGYRLYYKTSSGGWKRFKDTTATSFTDSGVSPNRTETYTIRCIDKNGKTVSGFNSKGWSKKYTAATPKITKLTNRSKGVSVTWNKIAGVYGYRLYRKYNGGSWTKVKDTTSTSFTDSGAKKGKKVTYTVRCIDRKGKTVSGFNSKGWSITRK
jgi:fibronectin type 3 domain-containing protein